MTFSKNLTWISYLFIFVIVTSCSRDNDSDNIPVNNPPDDFVLLEITNNAVDVPVNPQFSWGRATDSDGDSVTYSFLLDEGNDTPTSVLASQLQSTDFTVITNLELNTLYSWQIIASDGKGGITSSDVFSFTTRRNQPPTDFNLLQVPNNEANTDLKPVLTWGDATDPDGDTVTYTLLLDMGNDDPSTIVADNLADTSFEILQNLTHNTTYSWRIIASDGQGNETNSEVFTFTTRLFRETLATSNAQFSTRTEHSLIEFNGKLWVIGGYHAGNGSVNGGLLNDVWSSMDGVTWTEEVTNNLSTSFTPRTNHTTVVFQNKIWIIGGGGTNSLLNDVWSSTDGINWTLENNNANFAARISHTSVVFDNKIWIIGGENGTSEFDDIWSSTDGVNWILVTDDVVFPARFQHSCTVFQDKIWVIGGINSEQGSGLGDLNDVWSSSDGVNWSLENVDSDFSPRRGHSSVVYKDRIWVIAGNLRNDLWSSKDGINWSLETETANFNARSQQASLVFDDKLWVVGGWMGSLLNDVWFFD